DEGQLEQLLAFLSFDPNVVVSRLAPDEVEVSFLGSLNTAAQMMESELRLRLWLASHPDGIAVMQEEHRGVAVTPDTERFRFAQRTSGDVGEGIASVLALLGRADLISFAGGFPDPQTFPRERVAALLAEFAASGESTAFQYGPTRGL